MTKRKNCKHKIERRYGVCLWGQGDSPVHVRSYPPGQHGNKGPRKLTGYGEQFAAKQKLKGYYDILERQFRRTYDEASRRPGDTGENFLELLERRLDSVVYRLKLAPTVFSARQIVNHGHVLVNGRRVNIPSFRVKDGDKVTLREKMRQNLLVTTSLASSERSVPEYMSFEAGDFTGTFLFKPDALKIPFPIQMDVKSVVELYAR